MKVAIANTGFKRMVSLTKVDALGQQLLLKITSTWMGAKDPEEERVEFSGILSYSEAYALGHAIQEAIVHETV